jgi:hypothetical protein
MGTLQVGGTTLGVKNTSTNKVDLSNLGDIASGTIGDNVVFPVGTVVQVKSTIYNASNSQTNNTTNYVPTGLTVSITPKYSNSLMIIFWESGSSHWNAQNGNSKGIFAVYNGSSLITGSEKRFFWNTTGTTGHYGYINVSSHTSETLSGASTSTAITYQLYAKSDGSNFYYFYESAGTYRPTMTVYEVKQ